MRVGRESARRGGGDTPRHKDRRPWRPGLWSVSPERHTLRLHRSFVLFYDQGNRKNVNSGARLTVQIPALVLHSTVTSPSLGSLVGEMGVIVPTSVWKSLRMAGPGAWLVQLTSDT